MFSALLDWWSDLSPWWRYGVALAFIALSTVLLLAGRLWPWGWGVGVALLVASGRSQSEKNGYRF